MKLKMFFLTLLAIIGFEKGPYIAGAVDVVMGGENVGIEIRPNGLIISGTYDVKKGNRIYNPSKDSDIKRGDLLYEVEGNAISSLEEFSKIFNQYVEKTDTIQVSLERKNKKIQRKLEVIKEENRYRTGLYIKERIIGIGTISFYDIEKKIFGALGHAIVDNESGNVIEVKSGAIYTSKVTGVHPSSNGNPGEKVATFEEDHPLGTVLANTTIGIYGTYDELPKGKEPIPLAEADDVELGPATMYTVIQGSKIEAFSLEITHLAKQDPGSIKGITFKVKDETLLKKTGGIVAGMSGSPIVQNGKLIGAVTHVLVDKVQYGYGIYAEWMYQSALSYAKNVSIYNENANEVPFGI